MEERKVIRVDVSKMSTKETMDFLDPTGKMYKEHRLGEILFGCTAAVFLIFVVLVILL